MREPTEAEIVAEVARLNTLLDVTRDFSAVIGKDFPIIAKAMLIALAVIRMGGNGEAVGEFAAVLDDFSCDMLSRMEQHKTAQSN